MSTSEIDQAELERMLKKSGLNLTAPQLQSILPGAAIFRRMIERVNAPLPREAETATTFKVEQ
ncbi:MAG: hypothetical protein U1E60_20120 [Reyranellaceae bacterium]